MTTPTRIRRQSHSAAAARTRSHLGLWAALTLDPLPSILLVPAALVLFAVVSAGGVALPPGIG